MGGGVCGRPIAVSLCSHSHFEWLLRKAAEDNLDEYFSEPYKRYLKLILKSGDVVPVKNLHHMVYKRMLHYDGVIHSYFTDDKKTYYASLTPIDKEVCNSLFNSDEL